MEFSGGQAVSLSYLSPLAGLEVARIYLFGGLPAEIEIMLNSASVRVGIEAGLSMAKTHLSPII